MATCLPTSVEDRAKAESCSTASDDSKILRGSSSASASPTAGRISLRSPINPSTANPIGRIMKSHFSEKGGGGGKSEEQLIFLTNLARCEPEQSGVESEMFAQFLRVLELVYMFIW